MRNVSKMRRAIVLAATLALAGLAAPASAEPLAPAMRAMLSSTVQLVVERENGARRSGSSIVVARDENGKALLVTAAHVLTPEMEQDIHVLTPLERSPVLAKLLALDSDADLAILEVGTLAAKPIAFAAEATLGDPVWVASFPWGGRATVVSGMVSQIVWDDAQAASEFPLTGPVSLIDATVSHGMSGGGVFDRDSGALVGIVRSHRSVKVTLPGEDERSITLPVAGETNVVSTRRILCFLTDAGYSALIPDGLRRHISHETCKSLS